MMTTNKNQRTTHIDDVVKYQPRRECVRFFLSAHCAICDFSTIIYACILYSQMKMMKLLTLTLLFFVCANTFALILLCSLILSHTTLPFLIFTIFFIIPFILFCHTLFYPIVCLSKNYVSRQKFKMKGKKQITADERVSHANWWNELQKM